MIARTVCILICLGLAFAPATVVASDDGDAEGTCVWTAHSGSKVSAGYDLRECKASGGTAWYLV